MVRHDQTDKKIVLGEDMSLLAINRLYESCLLAKKNCFSEQSCCIPTSNHHVQFLSLFVMRHKVGSAATGKVQTFTDMVLGLL